MKKLAFPVLIFLSTLFSCGQGGPGSPKSFELSSLNGKDTINLVDANELRQGLWLMPISKDTMIYRNDTGYSTASSTSGEVMRFLKSGERNGFISLPDSMTAKSR